MKKLVLPLLIMLVLTGVSAFQTGNEIRKIDGKEYRVYKVQKGDTWYAIARMFEISYAELRVSNKGADDKLEIGEDILIPSKLKPNDPYFQKNYTDNKPKAAGADKFHTVEKSQTLFSISKMYGVTVDQIKEWNKLSSNSISLGQKLIVGRAENPSSIKAPEAAAIQPEKKMEEVPPISALPAEVKSDTISPPVTIIEKQTPKQGEEDVDTALVTSGVEDMISEKETEVKSIEQPVHVVNETAGNSGDDVVFGNGRIQVNETGSANWINEEDTYSDKYYALHRTAKIGTVIRVMNLENSRKIYVKVTGQLIDDAENEGILIRLSKASAEKLGITENTARVNLLYGAGDE